MAQTVRASNAKPMRRSPVSCELVRRELLSNFIDGEIGPDLRSTIEAHLHQCPPCAALHDTIRNVLHLLEGKCFFPVPGGYSQRLRKFLTDHLGK